MEFLAGLLPLKRRAARRDGIHLFDIRYWSDALIDLLGNHELKLQIRFDPRISPASMFNGRMDVSSKRNTRISHWSRCRCGNTKGREVALPTKGDTRIENENILFEAIREQRRIEDEAIRKSKIARRAEAQRPPNSKSTKMPNPQPDLGIIDASDPNLETFDMEILRDHQFRVK